MPPRSPFPIFSSSSDARVGLLQGLIIGAIVVTGLYLAREVLLPLVVAILLSFVLTPLLLVLRRLKVPRVLAVILVVTFAFSIIFGLGWMLSRQATELAENLPRYQLTISEKIGALRKSAESSSTFDRASDALKNLEQQLAKPTDKPATTATAGAPVVDTGLPKPVPVEIRERERRPFEILQDVAGTLLPPLATAGIVVLFVIFILLQREDLRDRLVRLIAASDLQRATATMNDAATRLSRFFLRQLLINAGFGAFITLGLWLIGIPTPIVWGILAGLMRFVPYIGSFISAAPPMLLAAVVDPGWTTVLVTGALFLVSELAMGQIVEPLVYGHGTGLSPIAVILSTVFWAWLWGPLGLLLATPLTVCLVVLGRHVEALNFFEVLLGDAPALTPAQSFYQRALIGDPAEATYQAELSLKEGRPLVTYLDEVALEGLKLAERDAERGNLDLEQMQRINETVDEVMDNLADFEPRRWFRKVAPERVEAEEPTGLASLANAEEDDEEDQFASLKPAELAPGWDTEESILCIGGRTPLDEAAAAMLAGLLQRRGLKATAIPSEAISAGQIVSLEASKAKLVFLSYFGTGSSAVQIRYLVRRLRRLLPKGALVMVGCWANGDGGALKTLQATAEADLYATSLREAADHCIEAARGQPAGETETAPARVA
jgi:predicted PurR-regulated permease PerM